MGHRIELVGKDAVLLGSPQELLLRPVRVYSIDDDLSREELDKVRDFLLDPIVERAAIDVSVLGDAPAKMGATLIEVGPKPGVTDPEGQEARRALSQVLGRDIGAVSYATQHLFDGEVDGAQYDVLQRSIGNQLTNAFRKLGPSAWTREGFPFHFPYVDLDPVPPFTYKLTADGLRLDADTTDEQLDRISAERMLALSTEEMRIIRTEHAMPYLIEARRMVGLEPSPTDADMENYGQSWSEHCKHKKFTGVWHYTSDDPDDVSGLPETVDNMFKSIIQSSTYRIAEGLDWLVSVFKDNAGVISLNDRWNIAHKVETHNHPSSLDGFGGANTGSGGVFRDPKHTGINMRVVSSQYGFRVAHPEAFDDLPDDIIPPGRTLETIVSGVEDYGNKMGIPTRLGNVFVDDGWGGKCAVYVGAVAVAPKMQAGKLTHEKHVLPGYIGITLGGRVGKDGIHGATASSTGLDADAEARRDVNQSVQIGNPLTEKEYFEACNALAQAGLIEASQDCGAGGWNSAVGELAELSGGGTLDLTHVLAKYDGLTGWEKLISEAQERGVLVVKPGNVDRVLEICDHLGVEALPIAEFNASGVYHVKDQDQSIALTSIDFLHGGLPQMHIYAHWSPCTNEEPVIADQDDLNDVFLDLLQSPNVQSFEWIATRYDHEVQGGSFTKQIIGRGRGRSDAVAYRPVLEEREVVIESWGSNPWQGDIDGYHMGANAVADAIGRTIAAGGDLERIAFNGNTTCPKPEADPEVAATVLRMLKGSADAEEVFGTPRISGKDSTSMQREYVSAKDGTTKRLKAKPELLMSSLGVIEDESTLTTPDFKLEGDLIYLVGETKDELGASEFYRLHGYVGRNVPESDVRAIKDRYEALSVAMRDGRVHSAQYLGKGGLACALANAAIAGDVGADVDLELIESDLGRADKLLFSETTGRFLVCVHPSQKAAFEQTMAEHYIAQIGEVTAEPRLYVEHKGITVVDLDVDHMREVWQGEIRY